MTAALDALVLIASTGASCTSVTAILVTLCAMLQSFHASSRNLPKFSANLCIYSSFPTCSTVGTDQPLLILHAHGCKHSSCWTQLATTDLLPPDGLLAFPRHGNLAIFPATFRVSARFRVELAKILEFGVCGTP